MIPKLTNHLFLNKSFKAILYSNEENILYYEYYEKCFSPFLKLVYDEWLSYEVSGTNTIYEKDIMILETYNGVDVTSIEPSKFSKKDIISIIIPDSITSISYNAFEFCVYLVSISLPNNLSIVDENNPIYNSGNGSNCLIETVTNKILFAYKNAVIPNTILLLVIMHSKILLFLVLIFL